MSQRKEAGFLSSYLQFEIKSVTTLSFSPGKQRSRVPPGPMTSSQAMGGKLLTRPSTSQNNRKKRTGSRSRTPVRRPVEPQVITPHWLFQTPPVSSKSTAKQSKSIKSAHSVRSVSPTRTSVSSTSTISPEPGPRLLSSTADLQSAASFMSGKEINVVSFFEPKSWARELRTSFLTSESLINVNGTLENRRNAGASTVDMHAGVIGESLKSKDQLAEIWRAHAAVAFNLPRLRFR